MTEEMRKKLLTKGVPLLPPSHRPPGQPLIGTVTHAPRTHNYSPLQWKDFFDEKLAVQTSAKCCFNVYSKGERSRSEQPTLFLLHGGGYSGLTWSCFAKIITELIDCRIIAMDSRGHGDTTTEDDKDLSAETQSDDVVAVINKLFESQIPPPIVLIGHSMGGAIAVHVAHQNTISNLIGLAVIDVVEGSAMDSLSCMQHFLRSRPQVFSSVEKAIEWCVRSGQVKNLESARVSMPGQITECTVDVMEDLNSLDENHETEISTSKGVKTEPGAASQSYRWRIDLSQTEPHWPGWFGGLSGMFLQCSPCKLLILAGVDRLDKDLIVGQMQGKFQMVVLPRVGHCVHEDSPDRVAETVASFLVRNRFAQSKAAFKPTTPC